ncbi:MAG: BlaI/MecI/CopY family transcriptional regulator [Clostridiales bacterium]|nr:BlaI/MecI/CopY family transcriptional regulator [Clostridiales bacterium]
MNQIIAKITESQLEILKVLWRERKPMSVPEIIHAFDGSSKWSPSTIKTLIRRLNGHGVLEMTYDGIRKYTSIVSEEDYRTYQAERLVEKTFEGSAGNLIAALLKRNMLDKTEMDRLRELLDEEV